MPSVFKYNGNEIIDSSGKVTATAMNSSGDAPVYGCRAWVNFDGTKDTSGASSTANTNRLIRGSGNVASVLRNGTGDYTITFTTPMPDANYAISGCSQYTNNVGQTFMEGPNDASKSSVRIYNKDYNNGKYDSVFISVQVFR